MADLFGAVVKEIIPLAADACKNAFSFDSALEETKSRLRIVESFIDRCEGRPDSVENTLPRLKSLRDEGKKLVSDCSKIGMVSRDNFKRPQYGKKLNSFNAELSRFFHFEMPLEHLLQASPGAVQKPPEGFPQPYTVPSTNWETVGLELPVRELRYRLLLDDRRSVLVVNAFSGWGKTRLAIEFCKDADVKGKFGANIFFITVSEMADQAEIIRTLIQRLGFMVSGNLDKHVTGKQLLDFFLGRIGKPVLVVLDDVSEASKSVLEMFAGVQSSTEYKILVTSESSFPEFGEPYPLESLTGQYPRKLLLQLIEPKENGTPFYKPERHLVDKILSMCNGVPLLLTSVGRSLCGRTAVEWKRKVEECSSAPSIINTEEGMLECLQKGLNLSDGDGNSNKVMESFMDFVSFPKSQRVPFDVLIDMWAELYGFSDVAAVANIVELSSRSLINPLVSRDFDDDYYTDLFVTQHDVLRQLAALLGSAQTRGLINRKGSGVSNYSDEPIKARLLSIYADDNDSCGWFPLEAPEVEVLILNFQANNFTVPEFIKKMRKLKALIVTNRSFFPAELITDHQSLGSSNETGSQTVSQRVTSYMATTLRYLGLLQHNEEQAGPFSNLKRIRLEKLIIPSLHYIATTFPNLQKISLYMCRVGDSFRDCPVQICNAFPSLEEIHIDYCRDLKELPTGISGITKLRILSITNCADLHSLPDDIGKLKQLEFLRIRSCVHLTELPESIGGLESLTSIDLSNCISLGKLPDSFGRLSNLKKIDIRGCQSLSLRYVPQPLKELDKSLETIVCDKERADRWKCYWPNFNGRMKSPKEVHSIDCFLYD